MQAKRPRPLLSFPWRRPTPAAVAPALAVVAALLTAAAPAVAGVPQDSYLVVALPAESPEDEGGAQSTVVGPADAMASPFGWHDTDGDDDPDFTDTRGNLTDVMATSGGRPSGGAGPLLNFAYPFDPDLGPTGGTNAEAAIVNVYYQLGLMHDLTWRYGFDEAAGNLQVNNYGNGGVGNDPIFVRTQFGTFCAGVSLGPDGVPAQMVHCTWPPQGGGPLPARDGAFDTTVNAHEFFHTVSLRLSGGPANNSCLTAEESGGEGWSDFWALVVTAKATDTAELPRGIGSYLLFEPPDGPGIRQFPYTTDLALNPLTYGDVATASVPHGVGEVWAATLWEAYWALVTRLGFDPDFFAGDGGNNLMIQVALDGLKLAPCNPSFVDARDSLLIAELVATGGVHQCALWRAFARRGLGVSAAAGTSNTGDETEAFDVPGECAAEIFADGFESGGCGAWSAAAPACAGGG